MEWIMFSSGTKGADQFTSTRTWCLHGALRQSQLGRMAQVDYSQPMPFHRSMDARVLTDKHLWKNHMESPGINHSFQILPGTK